MATASAVARYFLSLAAQGDEQGELSHMALHKLLYYAQRWSLCARGTPLFSDRIEAWKHGPVVPSVYTEFKQHGAEAITNASGSKEPELSPDERLLVRKIWRDYGQFAAWKLREMTHQEAPWRNARGSLPDDQPSTNPIPPASIKAASAAEFEARCERDGLDPEVLQRSLEDLRQGRTISMAEFVRELQ